MELNEIDFINDLNTLGYKNPFNLNEIVVDDSASFEFKFSNDMVYITNIIVYDTEVLKTTEALKKIIEITDKHSIVLSIAPFILKGTGLKDTEFLSWIKYFNFKYENGYLVRYN
jgi:hypothetical protein